MNSRIHIHATVSDNSLAYFRYMRANATALASGDSALRFVVYCLDAKSAQHFRKAGEDEVVEVDFARGSGGHAKAIQSALGRLVPGEMNVIADTDIVILQKDWDRMIRAAMSGPQRYGVIGTSYSPIGSRTGGTTRTQQYKSRPSATWMALSPDYDFSGLEMAPDKSAPLAIDTPELSARYGLPIGYELLKDVGWRIPEYLDVNGIPSLALDIVETTDEKAVALRRTNPYHDEFQWDGLPFLAHQRGSMKHRFRIDPLSVDFYEACDRYLDHPQWSVRPTPTEYAAATAGNIWRGGKRLAKKVLGRT